VIGEYDHIPCLYLCVTDSVDSDVTIGRQLSRLLLFRITGIGCTGLMTP